MRGRGGGAAGGGGGGAAAAAATLRGGGADALPPRGSTSGSGDSAGAAPAARGPGAASGRSKPAARARTFAGLDARLPPRAPHLDFGATSAPWHAVSSAAARPCAPRSNLGAAALSLGACLLVPPWARAPHPAWTWRPRAGTGTAAGQWAGSCAARRAAAPPRCAPRPARPRPPGPRPPAARARSPHGLRRCCCRAGNCTCCLRPGMRRAQKQLAGDWSTPASQLQRAPEWCPLYLVQGGSSPAEHMRS